jgi:hypothetical protein
MEKSRKNSVWFLTTLSIFLVFGLQKSFAGDTAVIPTLRLSNTFGFDISDQTSFSGVSGSLLATVPLLNFDKPFANSEYMRICKSLNEDHCDPKSNTIWANAILNPCNGDYSQPCVDSLQITDSSKKEYKLLFKRSVMGPIFKGEEKLGLPNGGTISLWHSDEIPGTKDFSVRYEMDFQHKKSLDPKFILNEIKVSISPYELRPQSGAIPVSFAEVPLNDPLRNNTGGAIRTLEGPRGNTNCVWQEMGVCAVEQEFENEFSYRLAIVIPNDFSGWLQGRLISPDVVITKLSSDLNLLTVSAKPADVPRLVVDIDYSKKNQSFDEFFKGSGAYQQNGNFRNNLPADTTVHVKYLEKFSEYIKDKANFKSTKWTFKSFKEKSAKTNKCLSSSTQLMGMVTTNSLMYESGAPTFNNLTLEYKVAGLHLNPDGTIFSGYYDLLLRSEAARCLYSFSAAPVSAEISVVSSDGVTQTTTTKISESNGWLHLGAYNFTFSNPSIKIKLIQQDKPPASVTTPISVASPTPSPVAANSKKLKMTCIKGKLTKQVVAVNPKCPAGYKKK